MLSGKESRAIYGFAFTMYELIKQIAMKCCDEKYKKAAKMILNDIDWEVRNA